MTNDEIGRAFVACARWEWRPGMIDDEGRRYQWHCVDRCVAACAEDGEGAAVWEEPPDDAYPDVTDPATLGAILGLVREAWGDERAIIRHFALSGPAWYLCDGSGQSMLDRQRYFHGPTEAEALLAALRGAPGKTT